MDIVDDSGLLDDLDYAFWGSYVPYGQQVNVTGQAGWRPILDQGRVNQVSASQFISDMNPIGSVRNMVGNIFQNISGMWRDNGQFHPGSDSFVGPMPGEFVPGSSEFVGPMQDDFVGPPEPEQHGPPEPDVHVGSPFRGLTRYNPTQDRLGGADIGDAGREGLAQARARGLQNQAQVQYSMNLGYD